MHYMYLPIECIFGILNKLRLKLVFQLGSLVLKKTKGILRKYMHFYLKSLFDKNNFGF